MASALFSPTAATTRHPLLPDRLPTANPVILKRSNRGWPPDLNQRPAVFPSSCGRAVLLLMLSRPQHQRHAEHTKVKLDGSKIQHQNRILEVMMKPLTHLAMVATLLAAGSNLTACSYVEGLMPGSTLAADCKTFKEQMAAHVQANPAVNGNLDQAANEAWRKKNQELIETLFNATGVTYNNRNNLDAVRETMTGLVQASAKCKVAGVDMININN